MLGYVFLAIVSGISLKEYFKQNRFVRHKNLLSVSTAPGISLIAPAYNEGFTIEENVRSLLSIDYTNFNVIVVNDGSKDDSLERLIRGYDLQLTTDVYDPAIPTKNVRGIYASKNPSFAKLIVVDKENGGKADALNVGVNLSKNPYVVCIDVDCVLENDVLLKLSKPFLEAHDKKVIATGGVVRIANSCEVQAGKLVKVQVPENILARIQVLEYLRAFLLGRMGWSKMDALLLISGAFGMFDRQVVVEAGGYDTSTVGEDMELLVRMRKMLYDKKVEHKVCFIPDPLCWTEAPETYTILRKQRSRWTRGTIETLWYHRDMFFKTKYKKLGLFSFPYWLVYEYAAPIIEATGLLITLLYVILGMLHPLYFVVLVAFVYSFALLFSAVAIYVEETTYHKYTSTKDLRKLMTAALVEPFIFHPFTVYAALRGNWEKIRGTHGWGDMTRKGFTKK